MYVVVDHKVKEYAKWKPAFDDHSSARRKLGSKGGLLFRVSGEPNHLVVLLEFDKKENATTFYESDDLKKVMQDAGVIGKPDVIFAEKIEDFKA
jgi:uncharacterized protein (DUF1330 family)